MHFKFSRKLENLEVNPGRHGENMRTPRPVIEPTASSSTNYCIVVSLQCKWNTVK